MRIALVLLTAWVIPCSCVWADVITKVDGTKLTGEIVIENDAEIRLKLIRHGMTGIVVIPRDQVHAIARGPIPATQPIDPPTTQPKIDPEKGYYVLPIMGRVGREITANALQEGLAEARRAKAKNIVLQFDTPGGDNREMYEIIKIIGNQKGLRIIAYVKNAISAGAIIAMSCPEIVMAPNGRIGATVPFHRTNTGLRDVDAKFKSAELARIKSIVASAGHDPLLAQAMEDIDQELYLSSAAGKITLWDALPAGERAQLIKRRGEILTLTEKEATAVGLSLTTAGDIDDIGLKLHLPGWGKLDSRGWYVMTKMGEDAAKQEAFKIKKEQLEQAQREYDAKAAPILAGLNAQLDEVRAAGRAAEDTLSNLRSQYNEERSIPEREMASARANYKATFYTESPQVRLAKLDAAGRAYDAEIARINARYQPQILEVQTKINVCAREQEKLVGQIKSIQAQRPK